MILYDILIFSTALKACTGLNAGGIQGIQEESRKSRRNPGRIQEESRIRLDSSGEDEPSHRKPWVRADEPGLLLWIRFLWLTLSEYILMSIYSEYTRLLWITPLVFTTVLDAGPCTLQAGAGSSSTVLLEKSQFYSYITLLPGDRYLARS